MKRVYLLRRAKSSWKHRELADRDRPLAGRGKRAAKGIARHMRAQGLEPDARSFAHPTAAGLGLLLPSTCARSAHGAKSRGATDARCRDEGVVDR